MKPVQRRAAADRDIAEAVAYYVREAPEVVMPFLDGLQRSYQRIQQFPASGSARYAHELDIPGLRHSLVGAFPYVMMYIEQPSAIDVWRVLHAQRDIPQWLRESTGSGYRVSEDRLAWPQAMDRSDSPTEA